MRQTGERYEKISTVIGVSIIILGFQNCAEKDLSIRNLYQNNSSLGQNQGETKAFKSIYSGASMNCAITHDDQVMCWGSNSYGQFGNGTTNGSLKPVMIGNLNGFKSLALAGNHACGITATDSVKCWGNNAFRELGHNSTDNSLIPVDVSGLTGGIRMISSNGGHSCALTTLGIVKCWGQNNLGQLGLNHINMVPVPGEVVGLSGIKYVAAGANHTCAITVNDTVKCWGYNGYGQLGNTTGTANFSAVPIDVLNLSGIKALALGGEHSCALTVSNTVKCWGRNFNGQLGNSVTQDSQSPVDVTNLGAVKSVSAGFRFTCAITMTDTVKCWGDGSQGQVGHGASTAIVSTPAEVANLASVNSVSLGSYFGCAFAGQASIKCWGWNNYGQLGNNTTVNSLTAVDSVLQ